MFKKLLQKLPYLLAGSVVFLGIFAGTTAFSACLNGYQGGTGICSATSTDVGKVLTVASSTPWLTYTFSTPSSGGSATTTITAGGITVQGPNFIIATSTNGSDWQVTASGTTFTFNFPTSLYGLLAIPHVTGTVPVADGNGNFVFRAPCPDGYTIIGSSTAPRGSECVLDLRGSGTSTQVAYYSGTNTLTSSPNLTTDGTNLTSGGYIQLNDSTQPAGISGALRLNSSVMNGVSRVQLTNPYTVNGCGILGRDNCQIVKNTTGGNLTIGQAVYINGSTGINPTVLKSQANSTTTAVTLGLVATTTVANNGFFYVMTKGILTNVDTSAWSAADVLYVSPTVAGGLTNVRPSYPNLVTRVGKVLVSNASVGQIDVQVAPAVLGQETGTISPTFNIGGNNAATVNNVVSSLVAGQDITLTNTTGTVTVANKFASSTYAKVANNLSDLQSSSTARTNLGLTDTATTASSTFSTKATTFYPIQWIIENPTASENDNVFVFRTTSTISSCYGVNKTAGDTLTFGLGYSASQGIATSSLFNLFSANTLTSTSTPTFVSITASSTPGLNNVLKFWTTAASSSQFTLTCFYSEN